MTSGDEYTVLEDSTLRLTSPTNLHAGTTVYVPEGMDWDLWCGGSPVCEPYGEEDGRIRGEIPNPPGLYEHDIKVHKVSLDACNLPTEEIK